MHLFSSSSLFPRCLRPPFKRNSPLYLRSQGPFFKKKKTTTKERKKETCPFLFAFFFSNSVVSCYVGKISQGIVFPLLDSSGFFSFHVLFRFVFISFIVPLMKGEIGCGLKWQVLSLSLRCLVGSPLSFVCYPTTEISCGCVCCVCVAVGLFRCLELLPSRSAPSRTNNREGQPVS